MKSSFLGLFAALALFGQTGFAGLYVEKFHCTQDGKPSNGYSVWLSSDVYNNLPSLGYQDGGVRVLNTVDSAVSEESKAILPAFQTGVTSLLKLAPGRNYTVLETTTTVISFAGDLSYQLRLQADAHSSAAHGFIISPTLTAVPYSSNDLNVPAGQLDPVKWSIKPVTCTTKNQ